LIALKVAGVLAAAFIAGGCFGGDDDSDDPTPSAVSSASASPSPSVPPATPTTDPYTRIPTDHVEARGWLQGILGPSRFEPACPEKLRQAGVGCAEGDVDGDGLAELAYLVPVKPANSSTPHPAAVFLRRGSSQKLEEFAFDLSADASILGLSLFELEDRTGDGKDDLVYLRNLCSTTCNSLAVIQVWDGTAWRDAGPGDEGIANIDDIGWQGDGAASVLSLHGGKISVATAGPTRAATYSYALRDGRYQRTTAKFDPPEYLYHAISDADELFRSDFAAAISAYEAAVADTALKDWHKETGRADGNPTLRGYALFKIAVATAAQGRDPTAAFDRVITSSNEPLFVNLVQEFRRAYQERGGVIPGCAAVNVYLNQPASGNFNAAAYVEEKFDYGYANPPGRTWLARICPL